jgi:PST family polysaccharide transporter
MSVDSNVGLGGRAVRGASITVAGQGIRILVLLVATVVLSRLLSPDDFGLIAVIASVVALGELCRDFGLSTAAARTVDLSRGQQSNLFWINTCLGLALTLLACALANPIATLFGQPELRGIMLVISVIFLINGLSTQFRAELNRQLRFTALTVVETLPAVVGLAGALVWATVDRTYWVLVVQQLVTAGAALVLAVVLAQWWPGLPSRHSSVRDLAGFGIALFGTQVIAYVTKNVDNISLGLRWGPAPLGVYSRAYQLLMLPINQISAPLTRVAVPVLTRVAGDPARFQRYLRSGQLVGGVVLGIVYGLCFGLADPLVHIVFGDQWSAMVPVFQALAVGGVFRALNQVVFWIFLATGKSGAQFRFYLVSQPVIIVAMLLGLPWGPTGVAIGHSVGYALNWAVSYWWCGRATSTPIRGLFLAGAANIAAFALPSGAVGLVCSTVFGGWAAVGAGIATLAVYLWALGRTPFGRGVYGALIEGAKMART